MTCSKCPPCNSNAQLSSPHLAALLGVSGTNPPGCKTTASATQRGLTRLRVLLLCFANYGWLDPPPTPESTPFRQQGEEERFSGSLQNSADSQFLIYSHKQ